MDLIEQLDKQAVKELFSKNWLTHDAMWYGLCAVELGPAVANRINKNAVRAMAAYEIKRIMKLMDIPGETHITEFDELVDILDTAFCVVQTNFMQFEYSFPKKNVLHGRFDACFAHAGLKQHGMIDTYDCGIVQRVKGWLEAIQVAYEMTPEFEGCLLHTIGSCEVDFHFQLG